jgi:hypothetical protein
MLLLLAGLDSPASLLMARQRSPRSIPYAFYVNVNMVVNLPPLFSIPIVDPANRPAQE